MSDFVKNDAKAAEDPSEVHARLLHELETEKTILKTMIDSIPDLIFCKDIDLNYTRCNKSLLNYFGLEENDIIGKNDENGLKLSEQIAKDYRASDRIALINEKGLRYEEYVPDAKGNMRLFETKKVPFLLNGKVEGIMGIAREITERKAMEDAAHEASRAKSSFLTNVSHEIRTPMNSIIGFSELALDSDISPETREYLNLIIENSKWLLQLINDLLDISKIESGNMVIEQIPFDLHEIFVACNNMIMPKAVEKNIDLFFYAEPVIGKMLVGDPTRLRQVIINLLTNAVKFTETGTVKIAALLVDEQGNPQTASAKNLPDDTRTLRFEIKDTGIGMTKEQIDTIQEPFTQADTSTTRKYGGTGLGISITKNIVELMGGKLIIESEPDVGTKISFQLTFGVTDTDDDQESVNILDDARKPLFKGEILICEDNNMNQRVIAEHLSRVGFKVDIAENGLDGVELARRRSKTRSRPYDLIFMDIYMPVMDGIEATSKIIALGVKTPIVAMTANVMIEDMDLYKKIGMVDYIGKPFTSQELWNLLMKYIEPVGFSNAKEQERRKADEELKNQLKADFVKDNGNTFERITRAAAKGDIKLAHRLAHSLKNSAGLINKTALQSAAADVESAFRSGEDHTTEMQMTILKTKLNVVLDELRHYFDDHANSGRPDLPHEELSADEISELYETLLPLLKRGSPKCLKYVGQLRRVPGSENLIEAIEGFDFKAAEEILDKIQET